jgi:peptidoglycan pentaglycine glycine transferase (the first glycine)
MQAAKLDTQIVPPDRINDPTEWNGLLVSLPYAHLLQTWEWGDFKQATTGWTPERLAFRRGGATVAAAQVLARRVGPLRVMYVPKGPALDYADAGMRQEVLAALRAHARAQGALFIKIDPDVVIGLGVPGEPDAQTDPLGQEVVADLSALGYRFSPEQIQFRNTVQIDLTQSEENILAGMSQKTRYNVRLADRKEVTVRPGMLDDLDALYRLYTLTAARDEFIIRPLDYYRKAWGDFMQAGLAQPLIAEYQGEPLAHVVIFHFGRRAWYFYGASSDEERSRMPNHALQWEAIRWARSQGCTVYDFWGAPDDFHDENDPLAGVFRFKSGFGGRVVRHIGAWDAPTHPLYRAYTMLMPIILEAMRRRARRRLSSHSRSDQNVK